MLLTGLVTLRALHFIRRKQILQYNFTLSNPTEFLVLISKSDGWRKSLMSKDNWLACRRLSAIGIVNRRKIG
jgi:hypothetical protein